jgi:parallel beta-helix repeat protein
MGRGWVVQDNEVRSNHGSGIACSNYARVLRNNVHHQGQIGISEGCGLVEGNEIAYNNTVGYNAAWEAGGTKWAFTDSLVVRGNFTHHNHGPGFWTDINNVNVIYEQNRVEDNDGPGIFHEISYKAVIRNNTVRRNGAARQPWVEGAGILVWSSRDVEIYGNTVEDNWGGGIYGVNTDRGTGTLGVYEMRNFWVHDNTITMSRGVNGLEGDGTAPLFTTFNNHWDRNIYHVTGVALPFNWLGPKTWAQWQAAGNDKNGTYTP